MTGPELPALYVKEQITSMHRFPDWSRRTAILLFWLFLWHLASLAVQNQILLVGPLDALKALAVQLASPASWGALWFSFGRISLGFFMAFLAGLLTGSLAFWKPLAGEILEPAIQFMKSVPVASFVILALIWTGAENLSVFISFLVVYPVIHINTLAGLSHADPGLLEMARVFRIPVWRQALSIYRISLYPYLESALKTSLGMGFKSGIAAEVIGVPGGSIGEGLYMAKIYLSTADLFAWTLMIIAVSSVFEKLFLLLLKTIAGNGVPGKEENHAASV